jgi:hypothetical protein
MNNWMKWGLVFGGGLVLGALGAVALGRGKINLRPLARDIVAGGIDLKEKTAAMMESAKEHFEDIVAEAVEARESKQKAEAAPGADATDKTSGAKA